MESSTAFNSSQLMWAERNSGDHCPAIDSPVDKTPPQPVVEESVVRVIFELRSLMSALGRFLGQFCHHNRSEIDGSSRDTRESHGTDRLIYFVCKN